MIRKASLLLLVLPLSTGCVVGPGLVVEQASAPPPAVDPMVERQITVARDEAPPSAVAALPPPSPRDRVQRDPIPFRVGAGYGALSHVDLEACRDQGLQPGYVHVRATFAPFGNVVRASVGSPVEPPPPALDCISERLRLVGVPNFEGAEATLSKTYFVAQGTTSAPSPAPEATP